MRNTNNIQLHKNAVPTTGRGLLERNESLSTTPIGLTCQIKATGLKGNTSGLVHIIRGAARDVSAEVSGVRGRIRSKQRQNAVAADKGTYSK